MSFTYFCCNFYFSTLQWCIKRRIFYFRFIYMSGTYIFFQSFYYNALFSYFTIEKNWLSHVYSSLIFLHVTLSWIPETAQAENESSRFSIKTIQTGMAIRQVFFSHCCEYYVLSMLKCTLTVLRRPFLSLFSIPFLLWRILNLRCDQVTNFQTNENDHVQIAIL